MFFTSYSPPNLYDIPFEVTPKLLKNVFEISFGISDKFTFKCSDLESHFNSFKQRNRILQRNRYISVFVLNKIIITFLIFHIFFFIYYETYQVFQNIFEWIYRKPRGVSD